MTGHDFDPDRAFAGLRSAVRAVARPPAPAAVRARAEHQLRRRRGIAVLAAAAGVVAVLLASANLTRIDAAPTPPPADPPSSAGPAPSPAPTQWAPPAPRPSLSVPPRPASTVDDPITMVDWANATITVPDRERCPTGRLRFRLGSTDGYPKMSLALSEYGARITYGDLTGDSRPEAVIEAYCIADEEGDHWPGNLLVIERRNDGSLRGVAWVGPAKWGIYRDTWVTDRTLYTEQQWSELDYEFSPGAAAAYRWDGSAFARVDSGLRGVETLVLEQPKRPIDLGADTDYVPRALGCPGGSVRFDTSPAPFQFEQRGYVYWIERLPGEPGYLADLDGDGHRYVLLKIRCLEGSGLPDDAYRRTTGNGILVLDRTGQGFRALDVVTQPAGYDYMGEWTVTEGRLNVSVSGGEGSAVETITFVWNGQYFQR